MAMKVNGMPLWGMSGGKNMRLSVRTWATAHTQTLRSVRWSIIESKFQWKESSVWLKSMLLNFVCCINQFNISLVFHLPKKVYIKNHDALMRHIISMQRQCNKLVKRYDGHGYKWSQKMHFKLSVFNI